MCQRCDESPRLTSLEYHQTSSGEIDPALQVVEPLSKYARFIKPDDEAFGGRPPTPEACETEFRHSGWRAARKRVYVALALAGVSPGRLKRFAACGSKCWVMFSPKSRTYCFMAKYCGDRFCVPCANARARIIQARITQLAGDDRLRMITFTRRATERTLTEAIAALRVPFQHVRESVLWREAVKGGASFVEIKKGAGSGLWHVHLHCLVVGTFLSQKLLSAEWQRVTGDSHVVDIRSGVDREAFVRYASKYASKGWCMEVLQDASAINECVRSLRGRRLFSTFGSWRGMDLEDDSTAITDWRSVGRFHVVYAAAVRGEEWARGVFTSIGVKAGAKVGAPSFSRIRGAPPLPPPQIADPSRSRLGDVLDRDPLAVARSAAGAGPRKSTEAGRYPF